MWLDYVWEADEDNGPLSQQGHELFGVGDGSGVRQPCLELVVFCAVCFQLRLGNGCVQCVCIRCLLFISTVSRLALLAACSRLCLRWT